MARRIVGVLVALLAFAAVLVAVPLVGTDPVDAHAKTVERCAYDPFTNTSQCWNEPVSHVHRCAAGMTGVWPNCYPIPPTPDPVPCPAGMTGTPPNCYPPPPATTQPPPPPTTQPPPTTTTTQPPPTTTTVPPTTTAYVPPTTTTTAPPECPRTGRQRNIRSQHRHIMGAQRYRNGGSMSDCHLAESSHCPGGQHEHVHGSLECHVLGSLVENASETHSGWTDHCAPGHHSHDHDGTCHAADPPYYEGVDIKKIEIADGYICYTTDTTAHGEVKSCTRIPEEDGAPEEVLDWLGDVGIDYAALLGCTAFGPLALKCGATVIGVLAVTELLEIFCVPGFCDEDDPPPVVGNDLKQPPEYQNEDDDEPPTSTTAPPTPGRITWNEVSQGLDDYNAGLITREEYEAIVARWDCQNGWKPACK